jgi:hypothetical protein
MGKGELTLPSLSGCDEESYFEILSLMLILSKKAYTNLLSFVLNVNLNMSVLSVINTTCFP